MSYIGNQPVLNTSEFREEFSVTSTQTVFNTGGFTASSDSATLEVLRNGVLLGTADYTLGSDASTVTLANAAVNGDIIVIKGRRELTNGVQVTERRHEHTMGSGETTVTFPYPLTVSQTDVYLNGVKLGSSDFNINSSTRVVSFTTNPAVGDLVAIVSREPALTANSSLPVVDAAGTNVLSESGGVVTLTADTAIIEGSSSGDLVRITQTGSGNALVVEDSTNPDSTPFVVNSDGRVLIGYSTPLVVGGVGQYIQGAGTGQEANLGLVRYTTLAGAAPNISIGRARGTAVGTNDIVQDNDSLGTLSFSGADGTSLISAASIIAQVDGTPATNDMPGRLEFRTTADGASNPTERMRIDSSGNVGIGTSSPAQIFHLQGSGAAARIDNSDLGSNVYGDILSETGGLLTLRSRGGSSSHGSIDLRTWNGTDDLSRMRIDSNGNLLVGTTSAIDSQYKAQFKQSNNVMLIQRSGGTEGVAIKFVNENGVESGSVYNRTSSTSFITSSDYRLKENITEITDGISRVKQLNPSRFNFIVEPNRTVDGFIAHEVSDIVPEAITGEKDAVNEDGSIKPQGIDQSKLVPLLTAALQESIALIEFQQSQIDALTARIEALETPTE